MPEILKFFIMWKILVYKFANCRDKIWNIINVFLTPQINLFITIAINNYSCFLKSLIFILKRKQVTQFGPLLIIRFVIFSHSGPGFL